MSLTLTGIREEELLEGAAADIFDTYDEWQEEHPEFGEYRPSDDDIFTILRLSYVTKLHLVGRKLVLYAVIRNFVDHGFECHPSIKFFARWCACTPRHVINLIGELAAANLIEVIHRKDPKTGATITNIYRIPENDQIASRQRKNRKEPSGAALRTDGPQEALVQPREERRSAKPVSCCPQVSPSARKTSPIANVGIPPVAPYRDAGVPEARSAAPDETLLSSLLPSIGGDEDPNVVTLLCVWPTPGADYSRVKRAYDQAMSYYGCSALDIERSAHDYLQWVRERNNGDSTRYTMALVRWLEEPSSEHPEVPNARSNSLSAWLTKRRAAAARSGSEQRKDALPELEVRWFRSGEDSFRAVVRKGTASIIDCSFPDSLTDEEAIERVRRDLLRNGGAR